MLRKKTHTHTYFFSELNHLGLSYCRLHRDRSRYNHSLQSVNDELINEMQSYPTLLLVLTKSFLEKEWNNVQIKTAIKFFSKLENRRVIAIADLADGDLANLDGELGNFILMKGLLIHWKTAIFWDLFQQELHRTNYSDEIVESDDDAASRIYSYISEKVEPSMLL